MRVLIANSSSGREQLGDPFPDPLLAVARASLVLAQWREWHLLWDHFELSVSCSEVSTPLPFSLSSCSHSFCSCFWIVPWDLDGMLSISHLRLNTVPSRIPSPLQRIGISTLIAIHCPAYMVKRHWMCTNWTIWKSFLSDLSTCSLDILIISVSLCHTKQVLNSSQR